MLRVFRHHVPAGSLLQFVLDAALFFFALLLAVTLHPTGTGHGDSSVLASATLFAVVMTAVNTAFGSYRSDGPRAQAATIGRSLLAMCAGFPIAYGLIAWLAHAAAARDAVLPAWLLACAGALLLRPALNWSRGGRFATRRVLLIGAGDDIATVEQGLATMRFPRYEIVGYVAPCGDSHAVGDPREIRHTQPLQQLAEQLRVDEIIVAVQQQRGGILPLRELLDCRLHGVLVMDLAGFRERVHREIPAEFLKSSSLIYGDGFEQGRVRRAVKRCFDLALGCALCAPASIVWLLLAREARRLDVPLFEGVRCTGRGNLEFDRLRLHRQLRRDLRRRAPGSLRLRLLAGRWIDELPQLINLLRGEMSLVGPFPLRPEVVQAMRQQSAFADLRHSVKPGITGWARVRCAGQRVDAAGRLRYDLYYAKNHSLFLDVLILLATIRIVVFNERAAPTREEFDGPKTLQTER